MSALSHILKGVRKIYKPFHVVTLTGDETLIEKMGDVKLSMNIILHNILLVTCFNCNLIFIHKLNHDLNFTITYD